MPKAASRIAGGIAAGARQVGRARSSTASAVAGHRWVSLEMAAVGSRRDGWWCRSRPARRTAWSRRFGRHSVVRRGTGRADRRLPARSLVAPERMTATSRGTAVGEVDAHSGSRRYSESASGPGSRSSEAGVGQRCPWVDQSCARPVGRASSRAMLAGRVLEGVEVGGATTEARRAQDQDRPAVADQGPAVPAIGAALVAARRGAPPETVGDRRGSVSMPRNPLRSETPQHDRRATAQFAKVGRLGRQRRDAARRRTWRRRPRPRPRAPG